MTDSSTPELASTGGWLRARLALQHFMQFAIWGSWGPVLVKHLQNIGFDEMECASIMGASPLAFMISPLLFGQIADRKFHAQRVLSALYLLAGVAFWMAARINDPAQFWEMWAAMFCAMFFFAPTMGLSNAVTFHHLLRPAAEYPAVRVWGTVGWIAGTFFYGVYMTLFELDLSACLESSGLLAVLNGVYCLSLPATPPSRNNDRRLAVRKVLLLLKDGSFRVYCFTSFALMIWISFYYFKAGKFFPTLGISDRWLGSVQSIGQASEIVTMLCLPFFLARLGFKRVIAIGMLAWGVRFMICAWGEPAWFVIGSQALHGFCFTFVTTAGAIYLNHICSPDARASAQTFLTWISAGLGLFMGAYVGGFVSDRFTQALPSAPETMVTEWPYVWVVPAIGAMLVLVVFVLGFHSRVKADGSPIEAE